MTANESQNAVGTGKQYSLVKILGIWAAAALPMGILGWVVYPVLTPDRLVLSHRGSAEVYAKLAPCEQTEPMAGNIRDNESLVIFDGSTSPTSDQWHSKGGKGRQK